MPCVLPLSDLFRNTPHESRETRSCGQHLQLCRITFTFIFWPFISFLFLPLKQLLKKSLIISNMPCQQIAFSLTKLCCNIQSTFSLFCLLRSSPFLNYNIAQQRRAILTNSQSHWTRGTTQQLWSDQNALSDQ